MSIATKAKPRVSQCQKLDFFDISFFGLEDSFFPPGKSKSVMIVLQLHSYGRSYSISSAQQTLIQTSVSLNDAILQALHDTLDSQKLFCTGALQLFPQPALRRAAVNGGGGKQVR